MTSAKDQLIELRRLLGEAGFVEGIWQMRENASTPPPKRYQRDWAWRRDKIVDLKAYRRKIDAENELVGSGISRL